VNTIRYNAALKWRQGHPRMGYVFISHSKLDKPYAREVIQQLRQHGIEAWMDDQRIRAGKRWWEAIVAALRDCSAFVLIMSDEAAQSDWVNNEILVAKEFEKPIFPLWRSGDPRHPTFLMLANIQYYDVREQDTFSEEFIETLRAYATADPLRVTSEGEVIALDSSDWQPNTQKMIDLYSARRRTLTRVGLGVGALVVIGAALVFAIPAIIDGGDETPVPTATVQEIAVVTPTQSGSIADQAFSPRLLNEWREGEGLDAFELNPILNAAASEVLLTATISGEITTLTPSEWNELVANVARQSGYVGTTQTIFLFDTGDQVVTLGAVLDQFQLMGDPFMTDYADYGYLQEESSTPGITNIVLLILGQPE